MHYPPPSRLRARKLASAAGALFTITLVAAIIAMASIYVLSLPPELTGLVAIAGLMVVGSAL